MIFDSHSHYDDDAFSSDREEIINSLKKNGISYVVNIGCDIKTSKMACKLSEKYPFFYFTAGFHPSYAHLLSDEAIEFLSEIKNHEKFVALGEIGLDYHYDFPHRDTQKNAFIKQMELADKLNISVCIHSRDATGDVMEIIRKFPNVKGVFHCYSGSVETAKELINLGYFISFSGTVTFKNAKNVKETAKFVPNDKYMVETDCPYLSPEPLRGKRNDSKNLVHTLKVIAELRGISYDEAVFETTRNAKNFYGVK